MLSNAGLDIEVISTIPALEALEPQWQELFNRSPAPPYWSFPWFITAWKYFGANRLIRVCVVRRKGQVVGIVPLELRYDRIGPLRRRILRCALGGWATRDGAILTPTGPRLLFAVLEHLANSEPTWDFCLLSGLRAGSPFIKEVLALGREVGNFTPCFERHEAVIIKLPNSWEAFRQRLGKSTRKSLRYRENVLARRGSLRLERIAFDDVGIKGKGCLEKLLVDALTVHRHSWQAEAEDGMSIGAPQVADFFLEVSRRMAEVGMLDLSILYVGDRPVSFQWGVARQGRLWGTKIGFDKRLADCGPGTVHMAKTIADSIERGATEIDWGDEFLGSKLYWSPTLEPVYRVCVYRPKPIARFIRWWRLRRSQSQCVPAAGDSGVS